MALGAAPSSAPLISTQDAVRLANQASFGPTEALVGTIRSQGAAQWVASQIALNKSRYTSGGSDAIHKNTSTTAFCSLPVNKSNTCWRDWYSSTPQLWDFYRNAVQQPDQLRQRMVMALSQILVVSDLEVSGSYGFRYYLNTLLDNAFGNYREVLKRTAVSPLMGAYLNNVNNSGTAPNENFARELLQLMSIGTCQLEQDGSLTGGTCLPTYSNETVRNYAYALTGYTYPTGGVAAAACSKGTNCLYFGGGMVPGAADRHDMNERPLLSGMKVPRGSNPSQALGLVLDSLIAHPNMPPFVGRQLIQHLVTSNPSPAYVKRVSAAFASGLYQSGSLAFGTGQRGDLAATVAAVLLDTEARNPNLGTEAGKLREPALMFTGVLRALNGKTDGDALGGWWGAALRQQMFRAPSIFNYFPPDAPVAGTTLVGPAFGIYGADSSMLRLNYLTYLLYWGGSTPNATVPKAIGTKIDLSPFIADAGDPAKLVDRFSVLATGAPLPADARDTIVAAVSSYSNMTTTTWQTDRVKQAAYLVFASPLYQVER